MNLEYRKRTESGVVGPSGYGEHKCKDYKEIFAFAEKWRVWNGKSSTEISEIAEDENIPGRVIKYDYASAREEAVWAD